MEELTRRELLRTGALTGAAAGLAGLGVEPLLSRALAAAPRCGSLNEIEHVVFLIQENRSFDHYFGTYRGVRGFDDRRNRGSFAQTGYPAPGHGGHLLPFHLDGHDAAASCTPDLTHDWGPQHRSWGGGRMDRFVREHIHSDPPGVGPLTMGYYTRRDLPFYHRLADLFTLCDGYHCSVMGPTDPNRLYSMSATIDPAGRRGGPLLETLVGTRGSKAGAFTWTTMPEQLSARDISWKHYTGQAGGILDNVLPYFRKFQTDKALIARGLEPVYPDDFVADVRHDRLPRVSWISGDVLYSEHPGFSSVHSGEYVSRQVLGALLSNRAVWEKTALFITWDENGGFFDHVPPPRPQPGTRGEYVTVPKLPPAAQGIRGPIGLGFRVPMLVVSPFSRGGLVCSDTFDHTSMLRFIEARFGAEVPNLSHWRRSVTGDLTSTFNFAVRPDPSRPKLAPIAKPPSCAANKPVTVPANHMPHQEPGRAGRPRPCPPPPPRRRPRRRAAPRFTG